jgi:hypothetical protein
MFKLIALENGLDNVQGFYCGATNVGMRTKSSDNTELNGDVSFIRSESPCDISALFTSNTFQAAPIKHFQKYPKDFQTDFVLINAMAARPDMENLLQEFLYKTDTPLDMEEAKVSKTSWLALKKIKAARLRDVANVTIIGIRQNDGRFIPMPKGDTIIMPDSKLLLIGTGTGIAKAKKIMRKKEKPEELKYV